MQTAYLISMTVAVSATLAHIALTIWADRKIAAMAAQYVETKTGGRP